MAERKGRKDSEVQVLIGAVQSPLKERQRGTALLSQRALWVLMNAHLQTA